MDLRLLSEDDDAVSEVVRWIASVLASPRFWALRDEWPDLIQETLVKVLDTLRKGRFDPSRELRPYVHAVTRHTAMEALERRRWNPITDIDPDRSGAPERSEERVISVQLAGLALHLLSGECRDLVRSYFYDEQSYSEIATSMGVPVGTVKSRLSRCLGSVCRIVRTRSSRLLDGVVGRPPSGPRRSEQ